MRARNPAGFGVVELSVAALVLALAVAPVLQMIGAGRARGVSEDRLLAIHLEARAALDGAAERIADGELPQPADSTEPVDETTPEAVTLGFEADAQVPGLWKVTARAWHIRADGRRVPYELSKLVRQRRAS
ncbi:MAG: hypothetical protein HYY25_06555 [Candidatus Wallbacteria bacterium]|nr:hypothetical protein [Candidatus Wallbacteria bacterium]